MSLSPLLSNIQKEQMSKRKHEMLKMYIDLKTINSLSFSLLQF